MDEIMAHSAEEMSPYSEDFPARLLMEAFDYQVQQSQEMTQRIVKDVVKKSGGSPVIPNAGEEKMRLVVDMSDDQLKDYQDGIIKLAIEKGKTVAQLKENGRYGSKLPVKEQKYQDGPDALSVQNAVQLQAIAEALTVISEQIRVIDEQVKETLTGQQNDRLALYYSGVSLYLEASQVQDEILRKQLLAQSIRALTDASYQLTLKLKSDIQYLANKKYLSDKKNQYNLLREKMQTIEQSFMAIHQATIMKAGIYCKQGEIKAFAGVLKEYEGFIKGTILTNAEMLSLCDSKDNGTLSGVWKKRANLQLDVADVVHRLTNPQQVVYISLKGEPIDESN